MVRVQPAVRIIGIGEKKDISVRVDQDKLVSKHEIVNRDIIAIRRPQDGQTSISALGGVKRHGAGLAADTQHGVEALVCISVETRKAFTTPNILAPLLTDGRVLVDHDVGDEDAASVKVGLLPPVNGPKGTFTIHVLVVEEEIFEYHSEKLPRERWEAGSSRGRRDPIFGAQVVHFDSQ